MSNAKPSRYRCEYCKQEYPSFQEVVSHCVASHADQQVFVARQDELEKAYTSMRFDITPSQHLRSGQRIVCSLDRMALGVIGAEHASEDVDKPQCASLELYLPLSSSCDSGDTAAKGSSTASAKTEDTDKTSTKTVTTAANKGKLEPCMMALDTNSEGAAKRTIKASQVSPAAKRSKIGSHTSIVPKPQPPALSIVNKNILKPSALSTIHESYLKPPTLSIVSKNMIASKVASKIGKSTVVATPSTTTVCAASGTSISGTMLPSFNIALPVRSTATSVATSPSVMSTLKTKLTTSQQVSTSMLSNLLTANAKATTLPVEQLTIQNAGWHSKLTTNNNNNKAVSDAYCLVPVDMSTGRVVDYLPKLPLSSLSQGATCLPFKSSAVPTESSHQLKIVDITSLATDETSSVNENVPSTPVTKTPSSAAPPATLQIGGVHFENTDLLSQAVVMRGGERSVSCITYSHDTLAHAVSPGLLICPNMDVVSIQTAEVKMHSKLDDNLLPPAEQRTKVHPSSNYKLIPLYVSGQSLRRRVPYKRADSVPEDVEVESVDKSKSDVDVNMDFEIVHIKKEVVDDGKNVPIVDVVGIDAEGTPAAGDTASTTAVIAKFEDSSSAVNDVATTSNITEERVAAGSDSATSVNVSASVDDSSITDSALTESAEANSALTDSAVTDSAVTDSVVTDGTVIDSTITDSTTISNDATIPVRESCTTVLTVTLTSDREMVVEDSAVTVDDNDKKSTEAIENYTYGCYLCNFVSSHEALVSRHWLEVHVPEKPYFCCYCCAVFSTSFKTLWHIRKFHSERKLSVAILPSQIYSNPLHFEVDLDDTDINATAILAQPANDYTYHEDDDEQQTSGQFVCRKCNFICRSTSAMKLHIRRQHLQYRPFSCLHCRSTFTCSFDLKRHQAAKHGKNSNSSNNKKDNRQRIAEKIDQKLKCNKCPFTCEELVHMHYHMIETHQFPASIKCPCCCYIVTLTEEERAQLKVNCNGCGDTLMLTECDPRVTARGADYTFGNRARDDPSGLVFICKICDYKTREKSGMTRHIKYNHTQCRPYRCAYCPYAAVEQPKVRIHIASNHRGRPPIVRKCEKAAQDFRNNIAMLFRKLTFTLNDMTEMDLYEGDGADIASGMKTDFRESHKLLREHRRTNTVKELLRAQRASLGSTQKDDDSLPKRPKKARSNNANVRCSICSLSFMSQTSCREHVNLVHGNVQNSAEQTITNKRLKGEHFRCNVCGYRCHDRSCMARHIKYMHLTSRPHSCPYCEYSNVEKTKVRLHVKATHRLRPLRVLTDERLLVSLSTEVKKYYVKINYAGKKITESQHSKYRGSVYPEVTAKSYDAASQVLVMNVQTDDPAEAGSAPHTDTLTVDLSNFVKKEKPEEEEEVSVTEIKQEPVDCVVVKQEPPENIDDVHSLPIIEYETEDGQVCPLLTENTEQQEEEVSSCEEPSPLHEHASQLAEDTNMQVDDESELEEEEEFDEKLHRMMPVVVVEDIIEKILSPSYSHN